MPSHYMEGDLQLGTDGRWRVFHKMIGAGHQGQWVYSQEMDSWLRNTVGATRVDGSGANMKLYASDAEGDIVLDLRKPEHFRAFQTIYNEQFGESGDELAQRAAEQGAPVDLKNSGERYMGKVRGRTLNGETGTGGYYLAPSIWSSSPG